MCIIKIVVLKICIPYSIVHELRMHVMGSFCVANGSMCMSLFIVEFYSFPILFPIILAGPCSFLFCIIPGKGKA